MGVNASQLALITLAFLQLLGVLYVAGVSKRVSRYSAMLKRLNECERMTADLESSFSSLLESHKRLRSRAGMRELRAREAEPERETKLQVRRRLFAGAAGPAFAKEQLRIAGGNSED